MLFNIKYAFQGKQYEEIIHSDSAEKAIETIKGIYEKDIQGMKFFVMVTDIQEHSI